MAFTIKVPNPKETYCVGRNGVFDVQAIEVLGCDGGKSVALTPIGKRGLLNAGFKIPKDVMLDICNRWLMNQILFDDKKKLDFKNDCAMIHNSLKQKDKKGKTMKNIPRNMLIEYVRERHNGIPRIVGMFVGTIDNGLIRVGFSRCHFPLDKFDKETGIAFAYKNMITQPSLPIGRNFAKKMEKFKARCKLYFKGVKAIWEFPVTKEISTKTLVSFVKLHGKTVKIAWKNRTGKSEKQQRQKSCEI
jgi:hypothetical protein